MPRVSKRARLLKSLRSVFNIRMKARAIRTLDDDEDSMEDALDAATAVVVRNANKKRFLFRSSKYRKGPSTSRFKMDLDESSEREEEKEQEKDNETFLPWLTDSEFLHKYRVSRENFKFILEKIEDHPVFQKQSRGRRQKPVAYQLMVFLKFIGTEGSGASNSNQRNTFAIGYGTAAVYRDRVTKALRSLSAEYINWPDQEERRTIAREIQVLYDFPHCVAIADGTLFPLAFEPQTEDAPDYSGQKYGYSLSTMIVCDHKRRIRHYLAGFPGTAHDNRIWKATKLATTPESYFDTMQYSVGDSAFENSWFMVSAFKKPKDHAIPASHEKFNEKLARMRIISEHCIGMLKGRFPWLRSIRLLITERKASLRQILHVLEATIVLHNMLIELGEEDNEDWINEDDFSAMDDAERAPHLPDDALNGAIPDGASKDERRSRLTFYFEEHFYFVPNQSQN